MGERKVAAKIRAAEGRRASGLIEVHVLTCTRTYSDVSCRCSGCGASMDAAALSSILPRGGAASFGISGTRGCVSELREKVRSRNDRLNLRIRCDIRR